MTAQDGPRAGDGATPSAFPEESSIPVPASVAASIYEHLRNEIRSGAIRPGSRLHQADLARRYRVSITPIREALSALTSDGYVDSSPFSGSVVHEPTLKELDDIYELRSYLVPMLVRASIAAITPAQLERARSEAEQMRAGVYEGTWADANRRFHLVLDSACDNGQLLMTMNRLADLSRAYVALSVASSSARRSEASAEHLELVSCYRAGDVEAATEVSLRHLEETHQLVHRLFAEQRGTPVQSTAEPVADVAVPRTQAMAKGAAGGEPGAPQRSTRGGRSPRRLDLSAAGKPDKEGARKWNTR